MGEPETPRRKIRIEVDDDHANIYGQWLLVSGVRGARWDAFNNGEHMGYALWSTGNLLWEPNVQSVSVQPSDAMLRLWHGLIGEACPVPRVVSP